MSPSGGITPESEGLAVSIVKPTAPWEPSISATPRIRCTACQGTGRIIIAMTDGKPVVSPCSVCADQRAIDDAVASRAVMDAAEKRLSEAAAKAAEKTAKAAAKMPTSAEVMADYAPLVAKLNEHYGPNPFAKSMVADRMMPDALPDEFAEAASQLPPFTKPALTDAQRNCEECGGSGVVMGDGQEEPCPNCNLRCSVCKQGMWMTESGWTCANGHGGAEEAGVPERQAEVMSTVANIPASAVAPGTCIACKRGPGLALCPDGTCKHCYVPGARPWIGAAARFDPTKLPPARILDISAALYHTDPIDPETPSLSNSIASTLVIDAPYISWLAHPRLGNVPTPPTKSMEAGTIMHALVLEAGRGIKPLPFDNWRTKEAKAARDDARADGLLPMLEREYEPLRATAADIRDTLTDIGMKLRGKSEVVVTWHERSKRGPVLCRAMMDHLIVDEHSAEIIDLKMITSADLRTCVRHIFDLGYDMQDSSYRSAIEHLYPHLAGRIRFRFAFCQVMPAGSPRRVLITPVELNGEFQVLGRERWGRAVETWKRCLDTDQWPGYVPDGHIERVAPMPWMLTGEMDQQRASAADDDSETDDETNES